MRIAAETLDEFPVTLFVFEAAIQSRKKINCPCVHFAGFAMHERHVEEQPHALIDGLIGAHTNSFLRKNQSSGIVGEGFWFIAKYMTRELIEDDYLSKSALG